MVILLLECSKIVMGRILEMLAIIERKLEVSGYSDFGTAEGSACSTTATWGI